MTIKSDRWIREMCMNHDLVQPFSAVSINRLENNHNQAIPSYGTSSYGYDVRLGTNFRFYKQAGDDPKGNWPKNRPVPGELENKRMYGYFKDDQLHYVQAEYAGEGNWIDPCNFNPNLMQEISYADKILIPPHGFVLGVTQERVKIPRDVLVTCMGKSTVARAASIVIVTPLEPEWEGYITLEITNSSDNYLLLTAGMGITQLVFSQSDEPCEVSYGDRAGKYQNQEAVAVPVR